MNNRHGLSFVHLAIGGAIAVSFVLSPPSECADFDDILQIIGGIKTGVGGDLNDDGITDHLDVFKVALEWRVNFFPTSLVATDPLDGEEGVSLTRETIILFDNPLDASSVQESAIFPTFQGEVILFNLHLSPDRRRVTLFYPESLPQRSRVRVTVDGDMLRDASGEFVDADRDGIAGGVATIDFDTLGIVTLPGSSVSGRVFASELATAKGTTQEINVPLTGVKITVDGAEDSLFTFTDTLGSFTLDPAPVGEFFVHIDGREVTSAMIGGVTVATSFPRGPYYPFVGKPWESVAGRDTDVGDVYLPLVLKGALQEVSSSEETMITFPDEVVSSHPELAGLALMVPADSLFADDGTRGGMVGIAPVDPDRLPGELPMGLEFPLVITVQTAAMNPVESAPTNFDIPAPICFPNLPDPVTGESLPPGTENFLYSFNHDKGIWEAIGSMTVSEDGSVICTDPGFGIVAPGWHGSGPPPFEPPPPPPHCDEESFKGTVFEDDIPCDICETPLEKALRMANCWAEFINRRTNEDLLYIAQSQACFRAGAQPFSDKCQKEEAQKSRSRKMNIENLTGACLSRVEEECKVLDVALIGCITGSLSDCLAFCEERLNRCIGMIDVGEFNRDIFFRIETATPESTDFTFFDQKRRICARQAVNCNDQCGSNCQKSRKLDAIVAPASRRTGGLTNSKTLSLEDPFDPLDPRLVEIEEIVEEILDLLVPFLGSDEDLPAGLLDQISALLDQTDAVAGGDAEAFLEDQARLFEAQIADFRFKFDPLPSEFSIPPALYMAQVERPDGSFQIRGETKPNGQYSLFVPADGELQYVLFYDPIGQQGGQIYPSLLGDPRALPRFSLAPLTADDPPFVDDNPFKASRSPDSDGDGLPDLAEEVLGTDSGNPDTDGDGIPDGAEVDQGTNPLDGLPARTGVIATAETPGTAVDVCTTEDLAILADSEGGVSVFSIFNGMDPILISQIPTPSAALRVACSEGRIGATLTDGSFVIIDITDPPAAQIMSTRNLGSNARSVYAVGGIAFVGLASGQIVLIDLASGLELGRLSVPSEVRDLEVRRDLLYVATPQTFYVLDPFSRTKGVLASVPSPGPGGTPNNRLFIGDEIAYTVHTRGYNTIDITDPTNPTLVAAAGTPQFGWEDLADNGSGLGIAAVGPQVSINGGRDVSLYDVGDASETNLFLTQFETPGKAAAVSLSNALAYVADRDRGLQVINYLAYDSQGSPPLIELSANFSLDPPEMQEAQTGIVIADVTDDVQVRNVSFFLDGEGVSTDGAFPFEFRFIAPRIIDQPTLTLQARAVDTGGNETFTEEIVITLTEDTTPPRVVAVSPPQDGFRSQLFSIAALFSEPLAATTVTERAFSVTQLDDIGKRVGTPITEFAVEYREEVFGVFLNFNESLSAARRRVTIEDSVTDIAGNILASSTSWEFWVYDIERDTDDDCVSDEIEMVLGLDPDDPDSDDDGVLDSQEDSDDDGLANCFEVLIGLDPTNPDSDGDNLPDGAELVLGTDPLNPDSDGDGFEDGGEVDLQSNPLNMNSLPVDVDFVFGEAGGPIISILNTIDPTGDPIREAGGPILSVDNQTGR